MTNKDGIFGDNSVKRIKGSDVVKWPEMDDWRHDRAEWSREASLRTDESESEGIEKYKENCSRQRE